MALFTSALFLLLGIIITLFYLKREWSDRFAHALIFPVAGVSYFVLVTYIFDAQYIHEKAGPAVAPSTGIAFCTLCLVLMFFRPRIWLIKLLSNRTMGGIIIRRLLPFLLILPLIIGFVRTGTEHYDLSHSGAGSAIITLAYTFCFVVILWFTARKINQIEDDRFEEKTSELRKLNHDLNTGIEERIKAEATVAWERKRFNDVLELMPAYIILLKDDYHIPYANKYFRDRFGESNNKRCYEYLFNRTEPCEVCETYKVLKENRSITWEWTGPDKRIYSIYNLPFSDIDGSKMIMEFGIDITELKHAEDDWKKLNTGLEQMVADRTSEVRQSENRYRTIASEQKIGMEELSTLNRTLNALGKSSQAMMHSKDEQQYLEEVCRIIVEDCGYSLIWIGYALDDKEKNILPVAFTGFEEGYLDTLKLTWSDSERGRGPTGTAIRTGKPAVCSNIQTDPFFEPWRKEAIKRGYASSVVLPIINEGKTFGSVSIYSKETNHFSEEEIHLLSEIADDLAYGITNLRLLESEKKAISLIRENEEKYRLLFERMSEGFALHEIITDENENPIDFRFLNLNPAFEKQTGIKSGGLIGKKVSEALPETEKYWIEKFGKVALTGESVEFENFNAGLNKYFKVNAFSPRKGYFASIFEDITTRVLAEKELRETKNYLQNLIKHANAPIIVWDSQKRIQLFNQAFEYLTGYSASEVTGKKLDVLFPKHTLKNANEKIRQTLSNNWKTVEIPILTKDNRIRTVLWNSANIYDEDKKIISTIAQGNDITERIFAEEQIKLSGEKLDLALKNGNIGTWEWDLETNNMSLDKRMEFILGIEHGTFQGTFDDFTKIISEDDITHVIKAVYETLENNVPFETVYRIKNIKGSFNYISAKASVIKNNEGKPVRMSGVCFDITDMKKGAERAMFKLNENLLRSNRELEQFAYVASHDLQEPLRMVSSFTQLLSLRYHDKLDKDAQDFIGYAVDGAVRMQNLINDLLEFSRIETLGRKFQPVDMNAALQQAVNILQINLDEKKAKVTNVDLPPVIADENQIILLFQNLIGNAIKFCRNQPNIHVSAIENDDHYIFSVKDNGIGIEPQYFDKIFKIFQRLQPKNDYRGTGIGLAICKRIIERHGGKIWVESRLGKGSVFYFTLIKRVSH